MNHLMNHLKNLKMKNKIYELFLYILNVDIFDNNKKLVQYLFDLFKFL
jgi:hypothetical protein